MLELSVEKHLLIMVQSQQQDAHEGTDAVMCAEEPVATALRGERRVKKGQV